MSPTSINTSIKTYNRVIYLKAIIDTEIGEWLKSNNDLKSIIEELLLYQLKSWKFILIWFDATIDEYNRVKNCDQINI